MATLAPYSAKRTAIAWPMPDVPPVTRTFLPFKPRMPSDTRAAAVMLMGIAPFHRIRGLIQRRFINRAAPMPVESATTAGCYIDLRIPDSCVPLERDASGALDCEPHADEAGRVIRPWPSRGFWQ